MRKRTSANIAARACWSDATEREAWEEAEAGGGAQSNHHSCDEEKKRRESDEARSEGLHINTHRIS